MAKRRQKQYRIGNSSRSQLGLGRRSMFVSQEKQAQHQAARRLKLWSRVVMTVVVLCVLFVAGFFLWFYLVPYFQQELITNAASQDPEASGEPLPDYDELGLPVYDDSVNFFVINQANPGGDYAPRLADIENIQVDYRIADALRQMVSAAKDDNLVLIFSDGYVSHQEQEARYEERVRAAMTDENLTAVMAKTAVRAQEPVGGESDFQTGLCLRLAADKETFEQSNTYAWLKANMGKYGFVFRYPEGKENYTDMDPDPTVLRYVGGENAELMQQRNMCLEEYKDYLEGK